MRALRIFGAGCLGWIAAVGLGGFSSFSYAWQSAPVVAGGTVTGHVVCGDTQRPARFANVVLLGVPAHITQLAKPGAKGAAADYKTAMDTLNMVQAQTDLEGGFIVRGVPPGDYYVFASVSGYVHPSNVVLAAYEAGSDLHYPISGISTVHVASERSAQVDLMAERGAAISGKVMWDDGSPAGRVMVTTIAAKGKKELPVEFNMLSAMNDGMEQLAFSDDRGHFRITGLMPGDYLVKGQIVTNVQYSVGGSMSNFRGRGDSPLIVFAPAAFHQADAKPVTLHTGEERDDVEMTISLKSMYTVSGRVSSREDHHGINSGGVKLEDTQDKEFSRATTIDANGDFTVTFVPAGSYNLEVLYARDTEPAKEKPSEGRVISDTVLRSYEDGKQAVVVIDNDVTGQNVELVPTKTAKNELNPDQ